MSKIPVFIERSARKGWNSSVESCIFIACESVETSSELGDTHEQDQQHQNEGRHYNDSNASNDNIEKDIDNERECSENRLIDKVQLNDTQDSKLDDEDENFQNCSRRIETTAHSLTVVSCCKGVVKRNCNCENCDEGISLNEFVTGKNMRNQSGQGKETSQSKSTRSFIPRPNKLIAGTINLTPAPARKSKKDPVRKINKEQKENNVFQRKSGFQKQVERNAYVINGLEKPNNCLSESLLDSICKTESSKSHEICQGNENYGEEEKSTQYLETGTGCNQNTMLERTCTESGLYRSQHDHEDSEPEYAQHEMQNGETPPVNIDVFNPKTKMETQTRLGDKPTITKVVHKSLSDKLSESPYVEKGSIKLIKAIIPRSGIQQFQHKRTASKSGDNMNHTKNWSSPSPQCVAVSSNISVTPRTISRDSVSSRNSSLSPDRNSVMSVHKSSTPSPRQGQFAQSSNLKSNSSVYDKSCSVYAAKDSAKTRKTSNLVLNGPQIKETKSSRLRKKIFSYSDTDDNTDDTNGRQKSLSRNEHDSVAVPTLKSKAVENKFLPQSRRNLPKAPSEVRKVRYGQRCLAEDDEMLTVSQPRPLAPKQTNGRPPSGQANVSSGGGGGKKKRAAWDVKGRLQDMEEEFKRKENENNQFLAQMKQCSERIAMLENHNDQLCGTVAQKEESYTHASREIEQLQGKLRKTEDELHDVRRQFERDTENFEFTKSSLRRQKEALEGEITSLQQEVNGLKMSVAQLTSSQAGLQSELEATKLVLGQTNNTVKERDVTIAQLQEKLAEQKKMTEDLNSKCRDHETMRRKLHNTIQELKGNIRVFCRVRPLVGEELFGNDGEIQHMNFPDEEQKTLELERLADVSLSESTIGGNRKGNGKYEFNFDRVFGPSAKQAEVFEEISQLVQSALDGYNVCIFAYGQTGSGKTFTMEGPSVEDEENRGMISRAVLQIFSSTHELEDKGWQYEFEGSFLEIYNETIRDLLGNHAADVKHEIKLTGTGGNDIMVTNLTTVPITNENRIPELLKTASKNRAVGETNCNERSSRSHSVFRLKITGFNEITQEQCKGTLNLVDLAGSERLKESGATGQRLKETQNINKSLSNLGNVIMALGNKENHVPYRNSKLTYLLQNSLGGNSKTLMFVNVSPREEHFSETLNSLRFATKVNQCNIGTATKKTK